MFEQITAGATPNAAGDLLRRARAAQVAARRAEVDLAVVAWEWACMHPSSAGAAGAGAADADDAAVFFDAAGVEPISGDGVPGVAEFAVAEFGTEMGVSTTAAKRLIGHVQELGHRLPRLWARVLAGEVDVWRARRVAEATIHAHPRLPSEAVAWIDAQVAPFAQKVGQAQVDRLVDETIRRFRLTTPIDPDDPLEGLRERRHVTIAAEQVAFDGTCEVTATLDLADALDLDHALVAEARVLTGLGSTETLEARRARALGIMARRQTSLDLTPQPSDSSTLLGSASDDDALTAPRIAARRLDLHLHFAADSFGYFAPTGFLENGQRLVLLDQVKAWCSESDTEVRFLPVIDLDAEISSDGYVPAPRLRRQVQLRDQTCVFPWCSRPSRGCDLDHVEPFDHSAPSAGDDPAQTRTTNLASLCRSHHRLKTHTGWRLSTPSNGVFDWESPHGHRYRRDRDGTTMRMPSLSPPCQCND